MICPTNTHRDEYKGKKETEELKTQSQAHVAVLAAESHLILSDIRACSHRGKRHVIIEVTVVKLLKLLNHMFLRCFLHLKESKQRCMMLPRITFCFYIQRALSCINVTDTAMKIQTFRA